jgi:hypothetical protein
MYASCNCCVLSSRSLCVGLITRPEDSYRLCVGACVNDRGASTMRSRPARNLCSMQKKKCFVVFLTVFNCPLISLRQFTGAPFC